MTNAEIIATIKAKVERLQKQLVRGACAAQIQMETSCKDEAYNEMLSILSDLEKEEKPMELDFEQELYKHFGQVKDFTLGMRIGQYFYELGCRRTAEKYDEIEYERQRASVSSEIPKDLEEAALKFADREYMVGDVDRSALYKGFWHGGKWQKEQMMDEWLKDRDGCFWDGVEEGKKAMREQMMKEAVEGWVSSTKGDHFGCVTSVPTDLGKLYGADK